MWNPKPKVCRIEFLHYAEHRQRRLTQTSTAINKDWISKYVATRQKSNTATRLLLSCNVFKREPNEDNNSKGDGVLRKILYIHVQ